MTIVRAGRLSRYSLLVVVVVLGLGFSAGMADQTAASRHPAAAGVTRPAPPAVSAPPFVNAPPAVTAPSPRACQGPTTIVGSIQNRTDMGILTAQVGLGSLTNRWCKEPEDDVRRGDQWSATDDSDGATEVFIIYLLENGDRWRVRARVGTDGTVDVGCSFELARPPRQDVVCQAEVPFRSPIRAFTRFILLPVNR
jgi:hypothetical protein